MNKATEVLKKAGTFYIATMDGEQPRVRPFGAVAEIGGKTYICTSNIKKCYAQMMANPKVEISGMIGPKWFRLFGTIVRDKSIENKTEFLKQCPISMYKPDDGIFEIFYFSDCSGTIESFNGPKEAF